MDFFSALSLDAPTAHLVAKGELDAFAAAQLRDRLDEAISRGCISFTVDTSAVTFVDAGGLGMLVRLSTAVAPFGGTVDVVAASRRFRQVAEIVGLGAALGLDLLPDAIFDPTNPCLTAVGERGSAGAHRQLPIPQDGSVDLSGRKTAQKATSDLG
jgi:anti-sigma B factor antagonist